MKCPGCGGELYYDIGSRRMLCGSCSQAYDPYLFDRDNKGAEIGLLDEGSYQTKVWLCPNCGAQLTYAGDTDVTAVCAYCGSANIIRARLKNEKRPETIIPFTVTKDDCKRAYKRALRHAFLSPGYLRKESQIDSFRGIYMPYWAYEAQLDDPVAMEYKGNSRRDGDYLYTDVYELKESVQGTFAGLSHDASKQFDDDISECLGPFPAEAEQPFTPGFLSGFYAETDDDREKPEYREQTRRLIADEIAAEAVSSQRFDPSGGRTHLSGAVKKLLARYKVNSESVQLPEKKLHTKRTMFPVWFMSCRSEKGMLYAAVNGSTGKVVADFPVSIARFLILALVIAVGLFTLLNLSDFMGRPLSTFALTGIISACACWANSNYFAGRKVREESRSEGARAFGLVTGFILLLFGGLGLALLLNAASTNVIRGIYVLFGVIFIFRSLAKRRGSAVYPKGSPERKLSAVTLLVTFASMVFIFFNVRNAVYYYASVINIILFLIQFCLTVRTHNERAFRRPPQFNKRGGNDHA